jgi:Fur family transcriptional regulator, ferric uptake regulator
MQQPPISPRPVSPRLAPKDQSPGQDDGAEIIRSLARRGRRLTGPRQTIVNFVAPRRDHFSAQEVWEDLRASQQGVGRATVFRTLELLVELGVLDRVHAGDGCHRYAVCETRHHHHLMCLDCSSVVLIAATEIERQIQRIALDASFELLTHHLELIGRCAECREQPGRSSTII